MHIVACKLFYFLLIYFLLYIWHGGFTSFICRCNVGKQHSVKARFLHSRWPLLVWLHSTSMCKLKGASFWAPAVANRLLRATSNIQPVLLNQPQLAEENAVPSYACRIAKLNNSAQQYLRKTVHFIAVTLNSEFYVDDFLIHQSILLLSLSIVPKRTAAVVQLSIIILQ